MTRFFLMVRKIVEKCGDNLTRLCIVVPGPPSEVVLLNIELRSFRVEWPLSSLPQDNGGAKIEEVRITLVVVQDHHFISKFYIVSVETEHSILQGLSDTDTYQIKMEFANRIGKCVIKVVNCDVPKLSVDRVQDDMNSFTFCQAMLYTLYLPPCSI